MLADAPDPRELRALRPDNRLGAMHVLLALAATAAGVLLSSSGVPVLWFVGQLILGAGFTTWFALLHEAGHKTLFRSARANGWAGQLAGFFALIPFRNWRLVHMRHHYWTGWKDLDPTTSTTLPRPMGRLERGLINLCWLCWLPLFSVVYRVQNYWWLPRLWRQFERRHQRQLLVRNTTIFLGLYLALFALVGLWQCLVTFGLALWLSFAFQDVLLLSQHSHIPMDHSGGDTVQAYAPVEQERFTRSLVFPRWFSRFVLLNLDAHELHHMYPAVPGYHLQQIRYAPANALGWWSWIAQAKRVPGHILIFQTRDETGWNL